jgi:hypothetical protein
MFKNMEDETMRCGSSLLRMLIVLRLGFECSFFLNINLKFIMHLYNITFDTSTVLVLATDYEQLYQILRDLDDKYRSKGRYELYYQWDKNTIDKCEIRVVSMKEAGIVSAVAH